MNNLSRELRKRNEIKLANELILIKASIFSRNKDRYDILYDDIYDLENKKKKGFFSRLFFSSEEDEEERRNTFSNLYSDMDTCEKLSKSFTEKHYFKQIKMIIKPFITGAKIAIGLVIITKILSLLKNILRLIK